MFLGWHRDELTGTLVRDEPGSGPVQPKPQSNGAGPAKAGGPVMLTPGRPGVVVNTDRGQLIKEARTALLATNWPPRIFRRGGVLARIGSDDDHRAVIVPLFAQGLRAELAERIAWVTVSEEKIVPAGVPSIVQDDLLSRADELTSVPVIDLVVTAPVFARDGSLVTRPGYAGEARVWYEPVDRMIVPPVSRQPSRAEIAAAARFLMAEYLGDFPFANEASRQHALGALLLPFARLMIDGPVPLQCVDASTPGTGKGLLQRALMFPALGRMLPALPGVVDDEEELRKLLTTALMRGQQIIRWDNVTRRVDSATLSSVLTEPVWQDRMLGCNRDIEVRVRAIFMMNGNNLSFSQEVARRAVPCRLDAGVEQPWRRGGFRHPDLMAWAAEHRGELVGAALTLIQGWIAAGRPGCSRTLGSYEKWAAVIGGIVEHAAGGAGVSAFLDGLDDLYSDAMSERDEMIAFLENWHQRLGERLVTPREIMAWASDLEPFGASASNSERGQVTRLGHGLLRIRGQVWDGYKAEKIGRSWRVIKV